MIEASAAMPLLSFHTPLGPVSLAEDNGAIVALDWGWGSVQEPTPLLREAQAWLDRYFDGALAEFDLPLAPCGTQYRQRVWAALRRIPSGETRTYAEIAAVAGGSPRAVGTANAANPIPILIPCHRVVARSGLGGYSGADGVRTKRHLLRLEARARGTATPLFDVAVV